MKTGPWIKLVRKNYSTVFKDLRDPWKNTGFPRIPSTSLNTKDHIVWFSQHRNVVSQWVGGEGFRLQSQEGQDLCAAEAAEYLIFNTSTEEQTVDLTNKDMTKDSERFSSWFYSVWRTTGPILWHEGGGGYMNVQTWGDTCEGPCTVEQWTKNTMQPSLSGPCVSS